MYQTTTYASPVGELTLASDGTALTGLWLEGQKYFGGTSGEELGPGQPDLPVFQAARAWLDRYFAGEKPSPAELPLAPAGTPFQRAVWEKLQAIPWGAVTTYGSWEGPPPGRWGAPWAATPSPLSFPATGWWGRTAASPATPGEWSGNSGSSPTRGWT